MTTQWAQFTLQCSQQHVPALAIDRSHLLQIALISRRTEIDQDGARDQERCCPVNESFLLCQAGKNLWDSHDAAQAHGGKGRFAKTFHIDDSSCGAKLQMAGAGIPLS